MIWEFFLWALAGVGLGATLAFAAIGLLRGYVYVSRLLVQRAHRRVCAVPGCANRKAYGASVCALHAMRENVAWRDRRTDTSRQRRSR